MSESNLALTISADPKLNAVYIAKIKDVKLQVPNDYEKDIRSILDTKIALITDINSPEDYKILVQAIALMKACKDRLAVINHHLKALHFQWSNIGRQAMRYIETNYYIQLNGVKDSIRKSVLTVAMEPIEEGIHKLKFLLDLSEQALNHLNDVNWAIKNSADMVSAYFQAVRGSVSLNPKEI